MAKKFAYPVAGQRGDASPADLVSYVMTDWRYFQERRRSVEDRWIEHWKVFNTKPRRPRIQGRSNAVSPHGAQAIRVLVPLIKQQLLATTPVIRSVPRKGELDEQARERDRLLQYVLEMADWKRVVLTDILKEALIFGVGMGFVHYDVQTRPYRVPQIVERVTEDGSLDVSFDRVETDEVIFNGPRIVYVPVEDVYWDPTAREFGPHTTVIHRFFRTRKELERDDTYDLEKLDSAMPTHSRFHDHGSLPIETIFEEQRRRVLGMDVVQLRRFQDDLIREGDELVELHQVTSGGNLFTIANRTALVREEQLDVVQPWFRLTVDPIPGEVFGKSIFDDNLATLDQRDFLINAIYDNIANIVHGRFVGVPGMYDKKSLRGGPGSVIKVRNMEMLQRLEQGEIATSAFNVLTVLDREWERGSGVSDILGQVGAGGGTNYPETATVGTIKQQNALAFVTEMVSHLTAGLVDMTKIVWDLLYEFWTPGQQIQLGGEDAGHFQMIGPDTLARDVDFRFVGPEYAAQQQEKIIALERSIPILGQLMQIGANVDPQSLALAYVDALNLPNKDHIVRDGPTDKGPDVEHQVMASGAPVQPERDEDHQTHLAQHVAELDRAEGVGEAEEYRELLSRHIRLHAEMIQRISQEAAQAQQEMALRAQARGSNAV